MFKKALVFTALLTLGASPLLASGSESEARAKAAKTVPYKIDTAHAHIGFSVSHLVVSRTKGEFTDYEGTIHFDAKKPANSNVDVTIQAKSIDTRNKKRDDHLRQADFFHVKEYPTITFKSTSIKKKKGSTYTVTGDLTIRGVTKRISFPAVYRGQVKDPWGNTRIGFEGALTIDRRDFGVAWNKKNETGTLVVGNEVKITLDFEAVKG